MSDQQPGGSRTEQLYLLEIAGPIPNSTALYPFYATPETKEEEIQSLLASIPNRPVIQIREMPQGFLVGRRFFPATREVKERAAASPANEAPPSTS